MKKFITTLLSVLLIAICVVGLVSCDGDKEGANAKFKYNITVWVGEDTKAITEEMITKFNKENDKSIWFTAKVNEVTESKASGDVIKDLEGAPEIFCFAQDQLARLVFSQALDAPKTNAITNIKATHTESAVAAATVGDVIYAYPLTEDNGYFLYYDTRYITADQAGSIEGIMEACSASNKYFSFGLDGGWYDASFFYATDSNGDSLCKSEWTVDAQGRFTAHDDTFNTDKGLIAAKGMQKVLQFSRYSKNGAASDFNASIPAAAVVSGIWDYETAKNALGNYLGIAKLPTFEVDGQTYQLRSYLGSKLLGVSPQSDANKAAALSLLAQYLTNEESQLARFNKLGWGPSAKAALTNSDVASNAALIALKLTATIRQGQYPTDWWTKCEVLSTKIKAAQSESALTTALGQYENDLDSLLG